MTDDAPPAAVAAAEAAAGVPLVRCAARIAKGPTARRIGIKMRHTRGGPVTVSHVAHIGPASRCLRVGDVIESVNGVRPEDCAHPLRAAVSAIISKPDLSIIIYRALPAVARADAPPAVAPAVGRPVLAEARLVLPTVLPLTKQAGQRIGIELFCAGGVEVPEQPDAGRPPQQVCVRVCVRYASACEFVRARGDHGSYGIPRAGPSLHAHATSTCADRTSPLRSALAPIARLPN